MLVSAISATHNQIVRPVNYGFINSRGGDNNADNTPIGNSFVAISRNDDSDVYKSINEWKSFCHKQIDAGRLNIIA